MTNKKSHRIIAHIFLVSVLSTFLFFSAHAILAADALAAVAAEVTAVPFAEINTSISIVSPEVKSEITSEVKLVVNVADYKPENGDQLQVTRRVGDPKDPKSRKNIANGTCDAFSEECFVGVRNTYPTNNLLEKYPYLLKEPNPFVKDGVYNIRVTIDNRHSSEPFPIIVNNSSSATSVPAVVPFAKVDKNIVILAPEIKRQISNETKLVVHITDYKVETKDPVEVTRRIGDPKDPRNQKAIADGTCEPFSRECFMGVRNPYLDPQLAEKYPYLLKEPNPFVKDGVYSVRVTVNNTNSSEPFPIIIDTTPPVITVNPYITNTTNQSITVTAFTNEGSINTMSHLFTANDSFNFVARDGAGNSTTRTVTITNIDKTAPTITILPYTTGATNQDITVTAMTNEGTLNTKTHLFTGNGSFNFIATDAAGNATTKTVSITNIDKTPPIISITPYTSGATNQNILVSASSNEGTLQTTSHLFTDNGSFDFIATDAAGNVTRRTVTISNIDRIAPVITIIPYNTKPTNQNIIVNATTNEGTLQTASHTFIENDKFTFFATDAAGNTSNKTVSISNIDRIAPIITIDPYDTNPTNQDVTISASTNEGTLQTDHHIFSDNGDFDFIATDAAGNVTSKKVTINHIDKIAPIISLAPYDTKPTHQDVLVNATTNEGTLNQTSYLFTQNDRFDFEATDAAGNIGYLKVIITNIDKTAPIITIEPYDTSPTRDTITVNVSTNKGTLNTDTHTFTDNGSFDFIATDAAGNSTTETVTIDNIDREPPIITVAPYDTGIINKDITVSVSTNEGRLNATTHTFTVNGDFDFIATDDAGNTTTKTITITNIDKIPPIITIDPYASNVTNQNVTITASTNEGTLQTSSHTFSENGDFEFIATDDAGNITSKKVTIDHIDKIAPIISFTPYNQNPTNQDITVVASTNEGQLNTTHMTFTENGNFDFIATDEAGNVTTQKVTIDNIDKVPPTITIQPYDTGLTNQDVVVTASSNEGTFNTINHIFTGNGSFTFIATDAAGNTASKTITINNIDKIPPIISIDPYNTGLTNQDILVKADTNEGNLHYSSHLFTGNGDFDFVASDEAGNVTTQKVTINNIDKEAPVIIVDPYISTATNQNILVNVSSNEGILNATQHLFTENGSFDFIATDGAGNTSTTTVNITNIDRIAPIITLNGDASITLTAGESYSELGANRSDAGDGSGTVDEVLGFLDTQTAGRYTLIYTKTDTAGNIGMANRMITVNPAAKIIKPTPTETPTQTTGTEGTGGTTPATTSPANNGGGGGGGGSNINGSGTSTSSGNTTGKVVSIISSGQIENNLLSGTANTGPIFSQEYIDAYTFAFANGITTKAPIEQANMTGGLARSHMAKMIANYAINVLHKTPNTSIICSFADLSGQTAEMQSYIVQSCQLGLMGQHIQNFYPTGKVTRAELGTVLSRMLYNTLESNDGNPYYLVHLNVLKANGVITNTDPNLFELRAYLMIMLMRAAT
ncbi:MAG: DUF5011 domain-containing protein [candidate division SR1 bacterium]|nr:DUF5011 domain-containing protein [candidate division SR1 bacterium]